jgi:DNA-binding response OmpR family regulator
MVQTRTVLVVDDSEVIRVMLCDLLRLWGYKPVTACDGSEALRLVLAEPIDAVFTDLQLGAINGLELCRELRSSAQGRGHTLPIWLMSGSDDKDYSAEAAEAGAIGFLRKPFNPADVARRLAAVLPIGLNPA